MTEAREKLEQGQVPFSDLVDIRTARDVRQIVSCPHCETLGLRNSMLFGWPYEQRYYHGRCFSAAFGEEALVHVTRDGSGKNLMMGDLGVDLMKKVMIASESSS